MSFFQILKSVSNSQIYGRFSLSKIDVQFSNQWPFLIVLNRHPILKSMAVSHFPKATSNNVTDVCSNLNQ